MTNKPEKPYPYENLICRFETAHNRLSDSKEKWKKLFKRESFVAIRKELKHIEGNIKEMRNAEKEARFYRNFLQFLIRHSIRDFASMSIHLRCVKGSISEQEKYPELVARSFENCQQLFESEFERLSTKSWIHETIPTTSGASPKVKKMKISGKEDRRTIRNNQCKSDTDSPKPSSNGGLRNEKVLPFKLVLDAKSGIVLDTELDCVALMKQDGTFVKYLTECSDFFIEWKARHFPRFASHSSVLYRDICAMIDSLENMILVGGSRCALVGHFITLKAEEPSHIKMASALQTWLDFWNQDAEREVAFWLAHMNRMYHLYVPEDFRSPLAKYSITKEKMQRSDSTVTIFGGNPMDELLDGISRQTGSTATDVHQC